MKVRVLVVEASTPTHNGLSPILSTIPEAEVVARAGDAIQALELVAHLQPDVITVDLETVDAGCLEPLSRLCRNSFGKLIAVSSAETDWAHEASADVDLDICSFVGRFGASHAFRDRMRQELQAAGSSSRTRLVCQQSHPSSNTANEHKLVVIAASTGGPKALMSLLQGLTSPFPAPIVIVQHMPASHVEAFTQRLSSLGTVVCRQAEQGDALEPGVALVAPGDKQIRLLPHREIWLTDRSPHHGLRSAADPLFRSAATVYGSRTIAVILSGRGRDGADGALEIRLAGGTVIAEAESSCSVYEMPAAAIRNGAATLVAPIESIAQAISKTITDPFVGRASRCLR